VTAPRPIGAVLAGGLGRRMGGAKAAVDIEGRPLITYPLEALQAVLPDVAVVAKGDTSLPVLRGVSIWVEPDEPRHPVAGIVHALRTAQGRPVLACAADLALVTPELVRRLVETDPSGAPAVVPRDARGLQPLLALYTPLALPALAGFDPSAPTREIVQALDPLVIEVDDEETFFNVNAPEDLLRASVVLRRRAGPRRPPREPQQPAPEEERRGTS
jgi:molybdopterin-guanine dinucleotide biosynthesis protein A